MTTVPIAVTVSDFIVPATVVPSPVFETTIACLDSQTPAAAIAVTGNDFIVPAAVVTSPFLTASMLDSDTPAAVLLMGVHMATAAIAVTGNGIYRPCKSCKFTSVPEMPAAAVRCYPIYDMFKNSIFPNRETH